jgi:hypothetical protein
MWDGFKLQLTEQINFTTVNLIDQIPDQTHLNLMENLIDDTNDKDFEIISNVLSSTAENIVRILARTDGSILYDRIAVSDVAGQATQFVAQIASQTFNNLFPLRQIITIIIVILCLIIIIIILIWICRYCARREKRKVCKNSVKRLRQLLAADEAETPV